MSGIRYQKFQKETNGDNVEECLVQTYTPTSTPKRIFFPSTEKIPTPTTPLLMVSDSEEGAIEAIAEGQNERRSFNESQNVVLNDERLIYPDEPLKTFLALIFLGLGFIVTTFSLVLTHERMPDVDPLPDILLDNVSYLSWGLRVCEYLMIISLISGVAVVVAHSHRMIVFRRVFLLLGLMYLYRAATFFVTVLPKSDKLYFCAPKTNGSLPISEIFQRVVDISLGGGMTINNKQVYCGDFIFSGHTMVLVTSYLVIREYTPSGWFIVHWASFTLSLTGVVFLVLGRGHYTVDILIAYFISTRMWWGYHTMASTSLKSISSNNSLRKLWWWRIFQFFEREVPGPIPNRYSVPLPLAWRTWLYNKMFKKQKVDTDIEAST